MKVTFKPADESLIHIIMEMMEEFYNHFSYTFKYEKTKENLEFFIRNPEVGCVWIFLDNNVYIGYAVICFSFSFEYSGKTAFIDELYLRESHRGQGVGGTVIDYIIEEAKKKGVHVVHMEVEKFNETGIKLYQKRGFHDQNRLLMSKWILP